MLSIYFRSAYFLLSLVFCFSGPVWSQDTSNSDVTILDKAMDIYIQEGVDKLVARIAIPGLERVAQAQAATFRQVEAFYGKPVSFSKLRTVSLGKKTTIVTFIMEYERGPTYGVATVYRHNARETLPYLKFHTNPLEILPNSLVFGK